MPMYNPPHPGEFIKETYIKPLHISLRKAAINLDVSCSAFSRLIKGEANISPEMAVRLSIAFGRSPESWVNMQRSYDLWIIRKQVNFSKVKIMYHHHA
jgi:addiction module HigA family antidote